MNIYKPLAYATLVSTLISSTGCQFISKSILETPKAEKELREALAPIGIGPGMGDTTHKGMSALGNAFSSISSYDHSTIENSQERNP
tara:strand:- start:1113 stop:1373 length:261 start_codon:yes stop_codon:yes gene_type:complete